MGKIEEMEKMLKEAHAEKSRLMESRVRRVWATQAEGMGVPALPSTCQGPHSTPSQLAHIILVYSLEGQNVLKLAFLEWGIGRLGEIVCFTPFRKRGGST